MDIKEETGCPVTSLINFDEMIRTNVLISRRIGCSRSFSWS